jgi:hypothetical protein
MAGSKESRVERNIDLDVQVQW